MEETVDTSAVGQRARAILKRVPKGGSVAELGVWDGALSEILVRAGLYVVMVDAWAPFEFRPQSYKDSGDPKALVSSEDMENARRKCASRFEHIPASEYVVQHMTTVTAATYHPSRSLDMVFIDADHSFDGVWWDIAAWRSKVKPGGYIGGHDFGDPVYPGVEMAVGHWFDDSEIELDDNRTWFVRL